MENWLKYNNFNSKKIVSGTTVKNRKFFNNFSLALHTGDNIEEIYKNREIFKKQFNENVKIVTLKQVHSDKIVNIDEIELLNGWIELPIEADAMVTTKRDVLLNILTADCLAIIVADENNGVIGAAHAGWRGTKQEIVKKLVKKMLTLGAEIENIKCAIAPGICGKCYEVGQEVANEFIDYPQALEQKENGKWLFDNREVNITQLKELGIKAENIEYTDYCTYCDNDKFFSYRKGDVKGRFVTFIGF